MLKELGTSMRPEQWYKNLVVFAGIVFTLNLLNFQMWLHIVSAFILFCMLSGSGYIINDISDIEEDRKHPKKRKRPIASGKLKSSHALLFAIVLMLVAVGSAYLINMQFLIISITYLLLTLAYSIFLKHIIIVDILAISTGFVIRAIAGCLAIKVSISPWLVICAYLLALFLALGKRRHEQTLLGKEAKTHRRTLEGYQTETLDQMISITSGALIISYSLCTFLAGKNMMLTIPFVIYGLFRYLFMVNAKDLGGEPEIVFKDRGILIAMGLWVVSSVLILYVVAEG